jgi:hypothetical protein
MSEDDRWTERSSCQSGSFEILFLFTLWIGLLKMDWGIGEGVLANIPSSPNISICETG